MIYVSFKCLMTYCLILIYFPTFDEFMYYLLWLSNHCQYLYFRNEEASVDYLSPACDYTVMLWSGREATSEIWSTVPQMISFVLWVGPGGGKCSCIRIGTRECRTWNHSVITGEESRAESLKVNKAQGQNGRTAEWEWSPNAEWTWERY